MNWQEFTREYFNFTRRDRIGTIVLLTLIVITLLLPSIMSGVNPNPVSENDTAWIAAVRKLELKDIPEKEENDPSHYTYDRPTRYFENPGELFFFDPNTLSSDGWKKLGLRDKTVQTIQNYLGKGGRFRKPEDLQRVYGLRKELYERLLPYIQIQEVKENLSKKDWEVKSFTKTESRSHSLIDINTADTSAFISLPGIGSKLALRIVNFRDKLGGFYTIEQVAETYGLPDSTFQKIKPRLTLANASLRKININSVTVEELKTHPYIKYSIANAIVAYRNEHGLFLKIEDLKKVMVVTEEIYNKIVYYIEVK